MSTKTISMVLILIMKVYSFQFNVELGKPENNLRKVLKALESCDDGSLVALPEMFMCGFDYERIKEHAKATPWILQEIAKVSKEKSLTVIGTYPMLEEGLLYNTAVVMCNGTVLGKRNKIELFPIYDEPKHFSAGRENPVFEVDNLRIGILICFELRFCYLSTQLRKKGAQLIVVPSMWGAKRKEHLKVLSQARAIETQSYLVLSNACGKTGDEEYAGSSAIYDPWGRTLAYAQQDELLISANIDLKEVEKVRKYIPMEDVNDS